jgi:predicted aspartyl protease
MTVFDPTDDLIVVETQIVGPDGSTVVCLALDTGATFTAINEQSLATVSCRPSGEMVEATTGSGEVRARKTTVQRIVALDRRRRDFPVLVHFLPPSAPVDGLLGLDFLRKRRLKIDFKKGKVTLY